MRLTALVWLAMKAISSSLVKASISFAVTPIDKYVRAICNCPDIVGRFIVTRSRIGSFRNGRRTSFKGTETPASSNASAPSCCMRRITRSSIRYAFVSLIS